MTARPRLALAVPGLVACALLAWVRPGTAGAPGDYAWSWPLDTEGQASAWRIRLDAGIYPLLADAEARDLAVFDADGRGVPLFRIPPDALIETRRAYAPLHFEVADRESRRESRRESDMPGENESDLVLELERADGTRLRLRAPGDGAREDRLQTVHEALIEAPHPAPGPVERRLEIEWVAADPLPAGLACELQDIDDPNGHYTRLDLHETPRTRPVQVVARVPVTPRTRAWYVHCRAAQLPERFELRRARVETRRRIDHGEAFEIDLRPRATGAGWWETRTGAPYAPLHFDVIDPQPNQLVRVRLLFRVPDSGRWRRHAEAELSTLERSNPGKVRFDVGRHVPRTTHDWRVEAEPPLAGPVRLVFHARAEEWVFLAQGRPPWRLYAGSRRAAPSDPDELAVATLGRLGPAWKLPLAEPGPRDVSGGEAALQPPPKPVPWQRYLLWAVLVCGAGLVVWLALTSFREDLGPQ